MENLPKNEMKIKKNRNHKPVGGFNPPQSEKLMKHTGFLRWVSFWKIGLLAAAVPAMLCFGSVDKSSPNPRKTM